MLKKDQLFTCLSAPQTEVTLPHGNAVDFLEFLEIMSNVCFMEKYDFHALFGEIT